MPTKETNDTSGAEEETKLHTLYCSFCGKSQQEVRKLIAGPTVFICDECVELCMEIIQAEPDLEFRTIKFGVAPKNMGELFEKLKISNDDLMSMTLSQFLLAFGPARRLAGKALNADQKRLEEITSLETELQEHRQSLEAIPELEKRLKKLKNNLNT